MAMEMRHQRNGWPCSSGPCVFGMMLLICATTSLSKQFMVTDVGRDCSLSNIIERRDKVDAEMSEGEMQKRLSE